jgi:hypothetical protein
MSTTVSMGSSNVMTASLQRSNVINATIIPSTPTNATIQRPNLATVNSVAITDTQSNPPISLKSNLNSINQGYIHNLLDVVENHPSDGSTLVYNSTTNKYEVKQITVFVTSLDGGSF